MQQASLLSAAVALALIWCLATVMMYLGTLPFCQTMAEVFGVKSTDPEHNPLAHLVALFITLVWCAITSSLPV